MAGVYMCFLHTVVLANKHQEDCQSSCVVRDGRNRAYIVCTAVLQMALVKECMCVCG